MAPPIRSYPLWMRNIFDDSIWRERPIFRSTSVPVSEQRAVVLDHDDPQSPRSLPDENQRNLEDLDWTIPLETIREKTPDLDLPGSAVGSPGTPPFYEIKSWDWLCFQELLGCPYWTNRGWVWLACAVFVPGNANNLHRMRFAISKKKSSKPIPADSRLL